MPKGQRLWTQEEVDTLYDLATVYPVESIAKQLNRSLGSVRGKARLLGIDSLSTEDEWFSVLQLSYLLKCTPFVILRLCKNGTLPFKWSAQTSNRGIRRIHRNDLKKLYKRRRSLKMWENAPPETLDWLFE